MRESKANLTDRLRREGRFETFKKRREELKAGGMVASDAWDAAAAEFPSLDAKSDAGTVPKANLQALKGKPPVSIVNAAAWAFEYLDTDWIKPSDAPSAGAWSMREWARSSIAARTEFYRTFAARIVLPPQEEARQAAERERQRRWDGDSMLRRTLDSFMLGPREKSDGTSPSVGNPSQG